MSRILKKVLISFIITILSIPQIAFAATEVYVTPSAHTVDTNTSFSLPIILNDVTDFKLASFNVSFDSQVISFEDGNTGALASAGCPSATITTTNVGGGEVNIIIDLGSCNGVNGGGVLASLNFLSGAAAGYTDITFSSTNIFDSSASLISATWTNASVTVEDNAPDPVPVMLSPATDTNVTVGDTYSSTLLFTGGEDVANVRTTITYDSSLLFYNESVAQGLFSQAGATFVVDDSNPNQLVLYTDTLGTLSSVTGDSSVVTFVFVAIGAGVTTLTQSDEQLNDSSFIPISATWADASLTINDFDTEKPVITLTGSNPQEITQGNSYIELGATASDNVDGNLTSSIDINSSNVNTNIVGSYSVVYNVSDSSSNTADTKTRTVNIVAAPDTEKPVITLIGNATIDLFVGGTYSEDGATASDNADGNLTSSINITNLGVDTNTVGTYFVLYDVTDSSENVADTVVRTINVSAIPDTEKPVITLIGNATIDLFVGGTYSEDGATASDNADGNLTSSINITNLGVDTNTVGTYFVLYDVTDSNENVADTVVRTINVSVAPDTEKPVITLTGSNPQEITQGDSYTELGATASDNADGNLTSSIDINSSNVNTNAIGSYTVTYNVIDSSSNTADTKTRTVNVVAAPDTQIPVITLTGSNPQEITQGDSYTELGATASDNADGNITSSININSSNVNTNSIGSYQVTYNVSDSSSNAADTKIRTVNVVAAPDTEKPVITLTGSNPQEITQGDSYTELGATASDNADGNLTSSIDINSSNVNTNAIGSYSVTYNVIDSSSNTADTKTRTVNVVAAPDTQIPVITLTGSNPQEITQGDSYTELGATASDNADGNLTSSIDINSSNVNTNSIGSYQVTYNVSDSSSNAADTKTRTVNVVEVPDTEKPLIVLVGANPQEITVGGTYNELGAKASDNIDGDLTSSIVINDTDVKTNTVGTYFVQYDVSDSSGNVADTAIRTINVSEVPDTEKPVITLVGANPQEVTQGNSYTELGATATDNADGDITSSIDINSSNVNTNAIGSYSVTYNVIDSSNNTADTITRTVNVVEVPDTEKPVITLIGANPQEITVGNSYTELGATASDNVDGVLTSSIVIDTSNLNTNTVGSYSITYDVVDSSSNTASTKTRTVNVIAAPDTEKPVITILGNNPQEITQGTSYVELGATAIDNVDGDLTASIDIISSNVDTNTTGSYSVTYNVIDSSSNIADTKTRTVNVVADQNNAKPQRSNGDPSGTLQSKTTSTGLSLDTDKASLCKYSKLANTNYGNMNLAFDTGLSTKHTKTISNLKSGENYKYYVRCQDENGNTNDDDYLISFSIKKSKRGGGGSIIDRYSQKITNLAYTRNSNKVSLSWKNPTDNNYKETVVVRSQQKLSTRNNFRVLEAVGDVIYRGTASNYTDTSTNNTKVYYYAVLAKNNAGVYSYPVILRANLPRKSTSVYTNNDDPVVKGISVTSYVYKYDNYSSLSDIDSNLAESISTDESQAIFNHNKWVGLSEETKNLYLKLSEKFDKSMNMRDKYAIAYFIHYGTPTTNSLGAGERAGVLESYYSSYNKFPKTSTDWKDVIKIANGKWPAQTSEKNLAIAKDNHFEKIYKRTPDMNNENDNAAVTVMAYGLRPSKRNTDSEKNAIKSFNEIFKRKPNTAIDWDMIRAIAYSGASR